MEDDAAQLPAIRPAEVALVPDLPADTFSADDLRAIAALPSEVRDAVLRWHALLEPLMPVTGRERVKGIQAKLAELGRATGLPLVSVRLRYDRFRKEGWRGLVNRSKAGRVWQKRTAATEPALTERPAFVDFWRGIMQQFQGRDQTGQAAHRALLRRLQAWERGDEDSRIPGYDVPPPRAPFTGLPVGWSKYNLLRAQYRLADDEAAAAKYGRGALADFRLPVLSTRVGLKVGQVVFFDDQEYDVRVNFVGVARESFRPEGFDAEDCLSAKQPLHCYKPVLVNDATGKRCKLTERDFRWFVAAYLTTVGYRPDTGTTFIVEHGKAAISPAFEQRIHQATGGLVRVDRGGISGQPAYPGMFEGRARGNFRFKAALESARVALRNDMAALPGAVGKDRDHAPEGDFGLDRYNTKALAAAVTLPPELAAQMLYPLLNWWRFVAVASEIHQLFDARTEHALEGWERCGHIADEYRLSIDSQQWIDARESFARMDERQRAAVRALVESTPGLWRSRRMSPDEVWNAGKGELIVLPEHALPLLLEPGDARHGEQCESNRLFIVQDRFVSPEALHYDASALVRQGCVVPGERYSVFLNPFAPKRLVVCDSALRYLGTAHLWERIGRLDDVQAGERLAAARRAEAPALANLARRGAAQTRRMIQMHESNGGTLAGRTRQTPRASIVETAETLETRILQAADDAALPSDCTRLSLPAPHAEPLAKTAVRSSDLDLL